MLMYVASRIPWTRTLKDLKPTCRWKSFKKTTCIYGTLCSVLRDRNNFIIAMKYYHSFTRIRSGKWPNCAPCKEFIDVTKRNWFLLPFWSYTSFFMSFYVINLGTDNSKNELIRKETENIFPIGKACRRLFIQEVFRSFIVPVDYGTRPTWNTSRTAATSFKILFNQYVTRSK